MEDFSLVVSGRLSSDRVVPRRLVAVVYVTSGSEEVLDSAALSKLVSLGSAPVGYSGDFRVEVARDAADAEMSIAIGIYDARRDELVALTPCPRKTKATTEHFELFWRTEREAPKPEAEAAPEARATAEKTANEARAKLRGNLTINGRLWQIDEEDGKGPKGPPRRIAARDCSKHCAALAGTRLRKAWFQRANAVLGEEASENFDSDGLNAAAKSLADALAKAAKEEGLARVVSPLLALGGDGLLLSRTPPTGTSAGGLSSKLSDLRRLLPGAVVEGPSLVPQPSTASSPRELKAKAAAVDGVSGGGGPSEVPGIVRARVEQLLKEGASAPPGGEPPAIPPRRPTRASIDESAADTTRVYDFHELRLAYEPRLALVPADDVADAVNPQPIVPWVVRAFLPKITSTDYRRFTLWALATGQDTGSLRAAGATFTLRNDQIRAARGVFDPYGGEEFFRERARLAGWTSSKTQAEWGTTLSMFSASSITFLADSDAVGNYIETLERERDDLEQVWSSHAFWKHSLDSEIYQPTRTDYGHTFYAPQTTNVGVLVTYRQDWVPQAYQVGDLISTIPLAPKEVRKVTAVRRTKKTRSRKELENSLKVRSGEDASAHRGESDIVEKARKSANFNVQAQGGIDLKLASFGASAGAGGEQGTENTSTKRKFREATHKAAREYRDERRLEVVTEELSESEFTTTKELMNPNEELTVTYMLYELQRTFRVSERIHRVEAVVLIANEIPSPSAIDWDWIAAHSWVLQRVILDDRFRPAIELASRGERQLDSAIAAVSAKRARIEGLLDEVRRQLATVEAAQATENKQLDLYAKTITGLMGQREGFITNTAEAIFGFDEKKEIEAAETGRELALEKLDRVMRDRSELSDRLGMQRSALEKAVTAYNETVAEVESSKRAVLVLQDHIRKNIVYYMQAIWSYEPPEQRALRLYGTQVPWDTEPGGDEIVGGAAAFDVAAFFFPPPTAPAGFRRLGEVAELGELLGFEGNYSIFRLRSVDYLNQYLMLPYVGGVDGAADPLGPARLIASGLDARGHVLRAAAPGGTRAERRMSDEDDRFTDLMQQVAEDERSVPDEIIVPTDQLYIEALPGTHPILEPFKLEHRGLDVEMARAELRARQLENVRLGARILSGGLEDPNVDLSIRADRAVDVNVSPPPPLEEPQE